MPKPRREDDEKTLHILDLHARGFKAPQIARMLRTSARSVRQRIERVVEEDSNHDPEAEDYWRRHAT